MADKAHFTVTTFMDKEDYRKFLYFATFRKTPALFVALILLSGISSLLLLFILKVFNPVVFAGIWVFMLLSCIAALSFKVERLTKKQINNNPEQLFEFPSILTFYENELVASNRNAEGSTRLAYHEFLSITETTDYIIFYFTDTTANLLRKRDVDKEELSQIREFLKEKAGKKYRII